MNSKKLQHVVLIKYKDSITPEQFKTIEEGAYTLNQIEGVHNLNYTTIMKKWELGLGQVLKSHNDLESHNDFRKPQRSGKPQ